MPGTLRQISLPGPTPDCVDDPLELRLGTTLKAGEYAFGLAADLPPATPLVNTFNMIISNQEGQVVDAAYEIPGQPIIQLGARNPTLFWTLAKPAARSSVTFGFTVTEPIIDILGVLLNFPDKFVHDIKKPTDVQNNCVEKPVGCFPVAAGGVWADYYNSNRLLIKADDTQVINRINPGYYSWTFPVLNPPNELPENNVWYLTLCDDEFCTKPSDRTARTTFPMAGWNFNQASPPPALIASASPTNSARHSRRPSGLSWATIIGGLVPAITTVLFAQCA
jgi:hypothetical protein